MRIFHTHQSRASGLRKIKEFDDSSRDDAQCSFAGNKKLLQIVARVVFAEPSHHVDDTTVGKHHFQAKHQIARVAVAKNSRTARVRCNAAAQTCCSFGRKAQRKEAAGFFCRLLCFFKNHTGLNRHGVVDRINLLNFVHARKRQQNRVALWRRGSSSHQTRVARLRHHRRARAIGPGKHLGNFFGIARANHGRCLAEESVAPVDQIPGGVGLLSKHIVFAHNGAQFGKHVHFFSVPFCALFVLPLVVAA